MNKTIILLSLVQAILIVVSIPAISYNISETNEFFNGIPGEGKTISFLRNSILNYLSKGLVSAQSQGFFTCPLDKQGSICQEYESSECNANCQQTCFQGPREDFFECSLGTCIDPEEGTCSANSPRAACTSAGGKWDERSKTEIPECRPGCCLINGNSKYVSENTCAVLESRTGQEAEFRQVDNEIACLELGNSQVEGACVLDEDENTGKRNCRFGTQASCLSSQGDFFEGVLCSNPELDTICEPQVKTSCYAEKDEVYWIDSCGNRENIYDSNKIRSFNNGKILLKQDSCSLSSGNDALGNQESCGNCNHFLGSLCGAEDSNNKAIQGDFVCRDLRCTDDKGELRENGESWCVFQSQIGVDGENGKDSQRSVDVPGSRHYKQYCQNGEIVTEPCADFRNGVCVESEDSTIDFSVAQCVPNRWQLCLEANGDEESLSKCEENSACFLKRVDVDKSFKFDVCVPKIPAGFDLNAGLGGEVGEGVCALGSQSCTYIEVKKAFGGWECEANCDCKEKEFAEDMNNLCMSLGDCGASVNTVGDFTDDGIGGNKRLKKLSQAYIDGLKKYAEPKEGQKVDRLTNEEISALYGISPTEFNTQSPLKIIAGIGAGAAGAIALSGYLAAVTTAGGFSAASTAFGGTAGSINYGISLLAGKATGFSGALHGTVASYAGAFMGAAIGLAVVAFAIDMLGLAPGLPPAVQYALIAGGAYSGGVIGFNILGGQALFAGALGISAIIVAGIVIAILVIGALLGWGDTRERKVVFTCLPWQPPAGGDKCSQCGEDGLGCSAYQCQSLGQNCEIINQDSDEVACIDVSPNDVTPPTIKPLQSALEEGFSYSTSNNGVALKGPGVDGCIPANTQVSFGIELNERGQCKIDNVRTSNYQDMSSFLSGSNLYKINHTTIFNLPAFESLNIPDSRQEFNLYVRCMDKAENANQQEYVVNFCLSPERDTQPPIIKKFNPVSPAYAALNASSKKVEFYTNEPAECKWSKQDEDYDSMTRQISCQNDFESGNVFGWPCNLTLPITANEEKYYIRCLDQPWLEDVPLAEKEGRERNANSESVIFDIKRTTTALKISDKKPAGIIEKSGLPANIDLTIKTEGGAESLPRYCYMDYGGYYTRFFESGTNNHKQNWKVFVEGKQTIPIRCEDGAGNIAMDKIEFKVELDNKGPKITRAYQQSGLTVITDEPAKCFYSTETCNFNMNNATQMSGNNLVHTSSFDEGLTYRIKCSDDFGNVGACLSVVGGFF